jgi:hypothetical protein
MGKRCYDSHTWLRKFKFEAFLFVENLTFVKLLGLGIGSLDGEQL